MSPSVATAGGRGAPSRGAPGLLRSWLPTTVERALAIQIGCQLALLIPTLAPFRIVLRSAAFGVSLVLLGIYFGRRGRHPAAAPALWVFGILLVEFFHPYTNSIEAGAAQIAMYLAIFGPLFWVGRSGADPACIERLLRLLWIFHSASALFGVLQAYYPGEFQPAISASMKDLEPYYIKLASGERVLRPMGLTDFPGGAAYAGFYAVLLGAKGLIELGAGWRRWLCVGSMGLGSVCLYMCQLRSLLVMTVLCLLALAGLLVRRGRLGRATSATVAVGVLLAITFSWAASVGGQSVTGRIETLFASEPGDVYYRSRGVFLEHTVEDLLPRYPLGAGLGRWGMMNGYFGDASDPERGAIWVEIQWTGWLLDGGVPLILACMATLGLLFWTTYQLAVGRAAKRTKLWLAAAVVLAYDLGALALTFNNTIFLSQMGLEVFVLNAALLASFQAEQRARHRASRQGSLPKGSP